MKFQMLPMGARFEYEGRVYLKTGPMTAVSEAGGQRMIPRFAVLKPLDGAVAAPARAGRKLDESAVLAAFDRFYAECADLLFGHEPDVQRARDLRAALERARDRFNSELEKA